MKAPNLGGIVLALVWQLLSQPAAALVIADSSLQLSGLSITPASGNVVFDAGSPTAQVFAQAANSLGGLGFQFNASPPDSVFAAASVAWAQATADADADATNLAASATSAVNLPGFDNSASSLGRGSLFGSFTLTGGTAGDAVDVRFSMQVTGSLHGFADAVGVIDDLEVVASLDVDGSHVLFDYVAFPDTTVSETFTVTVPLQFGISYFLFVEADSEIFAHNIPEPGTLALTLLGVAGLARTRHGASGRAAQFLRRA